MRNHVVLVLICCSFILARAQHELPCLNEDPFLLEQIHQNIPERIAAMQQADADLEAFTQQYVASEPGRAEEGGTYIIPVVFHVIHENGLERIEEAQIRDAIEILNRDLRKDNPDTSLIVSQFTGIAANAQIEFRLAQKDPNGNCTIGINWVNSSLTYDGTQTMKDLIQWPRDMYLNVWTCAYANGAAGYSNYPSSVDGLFGAPRDGIVLRHSYVGSIGTGSVGRSRTFTHEVGHWLNLRHCWGNSNDAAQASNCSMDDNVSDTPLTEGWTACNIFGQTCGSLDNVQNYMEYSGCRMMFTEGQKLRMHAALQSGTAERNELWQPSNLQTTGVTGPAVLCAVDFTADRTVICVGDTVRLTDISYHGITQWDWDLPGATMDSSSISAPAVVYLAPGIYDVSLIASNSSGSMSGTKSGFITVLPATGAPTPWQEGFEMTTMIPNTEWGVVDRGSDGGFLHTTSAAFTGNSAVMLENNMTKTGQVDELLSTTIDASGVTDVEVSFRYAFAKRGVDDDDRLRLYVSNTCGETWLLRGQWRGATDLSTAPIHTGTFIPTATEWSMGTVNVVSPAYFVDNLQLQFWFESDGGNDLYLDDINVSGIPVGVMNNELQHNSMVLVPNPVNERAELVCPVGVAGPLHVELLDVTGRVLATLFNAPVPPGSARIPMDLSSLLTGVYFIRAKQGDDPGLVLRMVKE